MLESMGADKGNTPRKLRLRQHMDKLSEYVLKYK